MSLLIPAPIDQKKNDGIAIPGRRPALLGELYEEAKDDLRLFLIYKKMEIAAEAGNWSLMNTLYREFKIAQSSMN